MDINLDFLKKIEKVLEGQMFYEDKDGESYNNDDVIEVLEELRKMIGG